MTRHGVAGFDGGLLRERRIAAGLSVSELARQAGIRPADVSRYEGGTMSPGPDRLAVLAGCVGAGPLDLVVEEQLGHGLQSLRAAAGLTQRALADAAGPDMTVSRLKSLELGNVRRLTHADTRELAKALGVSPETVRAAHQWDLDHAAD